MGSKVIVLVGLLLAMLTNMEEVTLVAVMVDVEAMVADAEGTVAGDVEATVAGDVGDTAEDVVADTAGTGGAVDTTAAGAAISLVRSRMLLVSHKTK
ncbi:hypothetical protein ACS0TY_036502 [Phlomoides rotata]